MSDNKEFIKLPESELEVMQAIWALNAEGEKFVSAGLIMKRFPALCRLKLTTVLTLITRLQNKGFISSEKHEDFIKKFIDLTLTRVEMHGII